MPNALARRFSSPVEAAAISPTSTAGRRTASRATRISATHRRPPFGYGIARQFGLSIVECRPALVPLTFNDADLARFGPLAGVATDAIAATDGQRFREKLLITHRGLSGPAILQISSYWKGPG